MKKPFKEETITLKVVDVKLRPAFLDDYIEARTQETFWKKKKEELQAEVKEYLKDNPIHEDIYYVKSSKKPTYDPVKLYEWLADLLEDEVLDPITTTVKSVDPAHLDELLVAGYIDDVPKDCYAIKEGGERIEIPMNRKRKKNE
jgi:hypothetical protein